MKNSTWMKIFFITVGVISCVAQAYGAWGLTGLRIMTTDVQRQLMQLENKLPVLEKVVLDLKKTLDLVQEPDRKEWFLKATQHVANMQQLIIEHKKSLSEWKTILYNAKQKLDAADENNVRQDQLDKIGEDLKNFETGISSLKVAYVKMIEAHLQVIHEIKTALGMPIVPSCSDPSANVRTAPIGFQCYTSKYVLFEKIEKIGFGEAWKDPDGRIWSDLVGHYEHLDSASNLWDGLNGTTITHSPATLACTAINAHLPSRADFEKGMAYGIAEVLPNMGNNEIYWTSEIYSAYSKILYDFAYGFYTGSGGSDYASRTNKNAVRCISW